MKNRLKSAWARLWRLSRGLRPKHDARHCLVLTLHRVLPAADMADSANRSMAVPDEGFAALLAYLKSTCRVLPLAELAEKLARGRPMPERAVCITFDDGYKDNYDFAFPALRAAGVPASIFVATDLIGDGDGHGPGPNYWWDEVEAMFRADPAWLRGLLSGPGAPPVYAAEALALAVPEPAGKRARLVSRFIRGTLRGGPPEARQAFLDWLAGAWEKAPGPKPRLLLSWAEMRAMRDSGLVDFGSHSASHAYFDEIGEERALGELGRSKAALEGKLGGACRAFAFPAGRHIPVAAEWLERAGYGLGFTSDPGVVRPGSPRYLLPRLDAGYLFLGSGFNPDFFEYRWERAAQ